MADLPPSIKDLVTKEKELKFDFNLIYGNSDQTYPYNTHIIEINSVKVPFGSVINKRKNRDIFALGIAARYGIGARTELYSKLTSKGFHSRGIDNDVNISPHIQSSKLKLDNIMFGVNHLFSKDNDTPALLAFAEISVAKNLDTYKSDKLDFIYAEGGTIDFLTYRRMDPVVISLTAGYEYTASRSVKGNDINPGDSLFISPILNFRVNNEVTISGGVQYDFRERGEIDGVKRGIRTSQTTFRPGVAYRAGKNIVLNFGISANISGDSSAQSVFSISYS